MKLVKEKITTTKTGFTLIELLVVVTIIGLVATIVAGQLNDARDSGIYSKFVQDIRQLHIAIDLWITEGNALIPSVDFATIDIFGATDIINDLDPIVSAGYIQSIPFAPGWPNNGLNTFGYSTRQWDTSGFWEGYDCNGDEQPEILALIFFAGDNPEVLDLAPFKNMPIPTQCQVPETGSWTCTYAGLPARCVAYDVF